MVLHMCGGGGTYFPYPNSTPLHASKNRGFGEEVGISLWIVLQGECQKDRSQRG